MIKQTIKQTGGLGKGVIKQILQEPLEIIKDAGSQVSGVENLATQQQQSQPMQKSPSPTPIPQPSIEERNKIRILSAHRRELGEEITRQRSQRLQKVEQIRMEETQKIEGEKREKEAENESIFQKGLKIVTGRLKRRMETRLPKAA